MLETVTYVEFDQQSKNFVMMSPLRLNFIRVDAERPILLDYEFQLDPKVFWRIIDVEMSVLDDTYDPDNLSILETSHCEVACIGKDKNSVSIFNIGDN